MSKKIEAKIVADSISPQGHRITSFILTSPRFIHSELMTHRMFSRNSASSRAIPFAKMVKMVEEDPFIPIAWQKEHKGMQGTEYFLKATEMPLENITSSIERKWLQGRDAAVVIAKRLNEFNVTKQLCNRLLEPFMWHTVLVTATEWENFFQLRCPQYVLEAHNDFDEVVETHVFKSKKEALDTFPNFYHADKQKFTSEFTDLDWLQINNAQAEIHIQALAESMWDAMNESKPKDLKAGEWHIPFGDNIDLNKAFSAGRYIAEITSDFNWGQEQTILNSVKIATSRCARLSYMTFDGEINYKKDIKLHDQLLRDGHMSPFEHCARAMSDEEYFSHFKGNKEWVFADESEFSKAHGWCNNFKGWIPYRYLIENKL